MPQVQAMAVNTNHVRIIRPIPTFPLPLSWPAVFGASNYFVYLGYAPGNYLTRTLVAGNPVVLHVVSQSTPATNISITLQVLTDRAAFVAVTSLDANMVETSKSPEISWMPATNTYCFMRGTNAVLQFWSTGGYAVDWQGTLGTNWQRVEGGWSSNAVVQAVHASGTQGFWRITR